MSKQLRDYKGIPIATPANMMLDVKRRKRKVLRDLSEYYDGILAEAIASYMAKDKTKTEVDIHRLEFPTSDRQTELKFLRLIENSHYRTYQTLRSKGFRVTLRQHTPTIGPNRNTKTTVHIWWGEEDD